MAPKKRTKKEESDDETEYSDSDPESIESEEEYSDDDDDNENEENEEIEEESVKGSDDEYQEEDDNDDEYDQTADEKKFTKGKKSKFKPNYESSLIIEDDDILPVYQEGEIEVAVDDRMSDPDLTYYEMVAIIGTRAQQLANSAPPLININAKDPFTIALAELREKMLPYKIKRYIGGNKVEIWKLRELNFIYDIPTELNY